ncbi:MAG: hypothetical protein QGI43_04585 [Gemmatimonadota bacterium]|nr:hypothetical protein [Gemmatimonadota bacterium]
MRRVALTGVGALLLWAMVAAPAFANVSIMRVTEEIVIDGDPESPAIAHWSQGEVSIPESAAADRRATLPPMVKESRESRETWGRGIVLRGILLLGRWSWIAW